MRAFIRRNGLTVALLGLFATSLLGQSIAGQMKYNEMRQMERQPAVTYAAYVVSGDFLEAVTENWEGEFLPIALVLALNATLAQKGSAESKQSEQGTGPGATPAGGVPDPDPKAGEQPARRAPWPVRKGGFALRIYRHSLLLAVLVLFAASFALHAINGVRDYNDQRQQLGKPPLTVPQYVADPLFWFQSLQNYQSEFLSAGLLVVLSIRLRQEGSPQSKAVEAANEETS